VCISVWSPRARDAAMRVYRVLAVLFIGPLVLIPMLLLVSRNQAWLQRAVDMFGFLWDLNPIIVLGKSMSSTFAVGAGFDFAPVLRMAAWHVGLSAVLIAWATFAVRRVHLREASRGEVNKAKKAERAPSRWRWRPTLGNNAMLWKEAFAPTAKTRLGFIGVAANVIVVSVALVCTGYVFLASATSLDFWDAEDYFIYSAIFTGIVGSGLLLLLGARASSLFSLEKERDTWISLLSTPLTGKDIVLGKLWGNLYSARWGVALLAVTWMLGLLFDASYALVILLLVGTFLLCAVFVTSVGLVFSLRSSTSLRAMGLTMATVLFVGGGYMLCCCPVLAMGRGGDDPEFGFAACLPFLIVAPAAFFADEGAGSGDTEALAAYITGVILYLIATSVLLAWLVNNFDEAAGRTADRPDAYARG
jgi:ABC-type transport system involved in multi-copper enzyme maturation permease subunit